MAHSMDELSSSVLVYDHTLWLALEEGSCDADEGAAEIIALARRERSVVESVRERFVSLLPLVPEDPEVHAALLLLDRALIRGQKRGLWRDPEPDWRDADWDSV
jgi:hypothetical protein